MFFNIWNGLLITQNCGEAKPSRRKPPPIKIKQDWQERFKNIRIRKKGLDNTEKAENSKMAYAIFDENLYLIREREFFHSEVCYFSCCLILLAHLVLYDYILFLYKKEHWLAAMIFSYFKTPVQFKLSCFLIDELMHRLTLFRIQNTVLEHKILKLLVQILFLLHMSWDNWL